MLKTHSQIGDWTVFLMFEMEDYDSDNNNFIFTPDHLETIIKYEEMVTEDDTWKNYYCYVGDDTTYYQCSYFSFDCDP